MPIITRWAPTARAFSSAAFRLVRTPSSKAVKPCLWSCLGGTLISRLNCPSSVWKDGSAIAPSTSLLFSDGLPSSSTRFSSISSPVIGSSASKRASRSIRANTSRHRRTFSR